MAHSVYIYTVLFAAASFVPLLVGTVVGSPGAGLLAGQRYRPSFSPHAYRQAPGRETRGRAHWPADI